MKRLIAYLLLIPILILSCTKDTPAVMFTLSVSASAGGTVSSQGGSYEEGSSITLTATADAEYVFTGWSNGSTSNPLSITLNSNQSITANFSKKKYPLSISTVGEGTVTEEIVSAGKDYNSGTVVKLTAIPNINGWEFTGWTGAVESTENPIQITVNEAKSITATFNDDLKQSVLGKWDFGGSTTGKGNQTATTENCTVLSIIFNSDMTFKMYVGNIVLLGDFSISNNTITFSIADETIGTISEITVEGTSLSATFNISNYCVQVNVAQKVEDYGQGTTTYMPDDTFEQIMIDAGLDDVLDNYVLTEKLKTITDFRHWRGQTWIKFNDGNEYTRWFDDSERYAVKNGNTDANGVELWSVNPSNNYKFIYNVAGLEDFENLETFQMFVNHINEVDFSHNTKLNFYGLAYGTSKFKIRLPEPRPEKLSIYIGDFNWDSTTIDLSGDLFQANELLWVYNFQPIEGYSTFITDVTGLSNVKATQFGLFKQHFASINLSDLRKDVKQLYLDNNLLTTVDVGAFTELEDFSFYSNPITSIDVSKLTKLKSLGAGGTSLESLDISHQGIMGTLLVDNNPKLYCIKVNEEQLNNIPEYNSSGDSMHLGWLKDEQATYRTTCENPIYIDENGVTIKAYDWANVGDIGWINGVEYTIVDEATLRQMVANDEDLTKVVTSKVTGMSNLFEGKVSFNQNIESWDTSNVTDMNHMFINASIFNQPIGSWNTSNVTNMMGLFYRAFEFNQDISKWNTIKVTNMNALFSDAVSFNQPIGEWDTSNVTNMSLMFNADGNYKAVFNQDISSWDTSKVTDMNHMFSNNVKFNQPIGSWDTSQVTDMSGMFSGSSDTYTVFNQDISNWNTSQVRFMWGMFSQNSKFNQPIGEWDTSNLEGLAAMFWRASSFNQPIGNWNISKATNLRFMFSDALEFNQDISKWDTSNVTDMYEMFGGAINFNQEIGNWNVSNVTDMMQMFRSCSNFNQNIGDWNVSKVTTMRGMFKGATSFNQNIGLWNTSSVLNMLELFYQAKTFNSYIGDWDTSNVTEMAGMFDGATSFNQDLSKWNTANVANMQAMFKNTPFNQNIGDWNVSKVINMKVMFEGCMINQDLSKWCVSNITSKPEGFDDRATAWTLPRPVWGTCPE